MARIPQYSRSVTPQNTPYEYVRSNANPAAFGAGVYEAGQNLGNSMLAMSDSMATLKANYDKTKLLEMSNYIDNWSNENLYDKDKGYFNKTGKEAMGKSPEVMDSYDKYADEYISKAGFTGGYNVQARRIVQQKRNSIEYHVMSHDKRETDRWQDAVYTDAMNNVYTKAIKGRNDANEIQKYYSDGEIIFDNYAALKGWDKDEETKNIMKKEYNANFHGKVLDALLADGSLQSEKYFNEHKEDFSPEVQNKYAQRIHTETINYTARTIASGLVSKSPTEAYQEIDKIENIDLRNAVENEYNRSLRHQEIIQRQNDIQQSNSIMQEVYYAFENGEDVSSIMRKVNISNMSIEQKEKIYKNIQAMQELEGVGNNWADYNILLDMAAFDNEEFKKINPANYSLTKEQYNSIVNMQRKSAQNEYTPETAMRKAINDLSGFAPQTSNGLKTGEYKDEVVRFLSKVERMQGKAFDLNNKEQLKAIMAGFEYKNPNATNKNIDETKELFARAKKHGEVYDTMAREYMQFKGQNKREPNPEEIYEMAKRSYNKIETEWKQRDYGKLKTSESIYKNVVSTTPKKGETKVVTYYADVRIPQISREIGVPLVITSRYRAGDSGNHGKGRKIDIGMNNLNGNQRVKAFEAMLSDPAVASIGTSDPILLKRYNNPKNPKIRDLREYDTNYHKAHPNTSMNHVNHMDVSFDTRYGGDTQGK
jgi:hypothetical protein